MRYVRGRRIYGGRTSPGRRMRSPSYHFSGGDACEVALVGRSPFSLHLQHQAVGAARRPCSSHDSALFWRCFWIMAAFLPFQGRRKSWRGVRANHSRSIVIRLINCTSPSAATGPGIVSHACTARADGAEHSRTPLPNCHPNESCSLTVCTDNLFVTRCGRVIAEFHAGETSARVREISIRSPRAMCASFVLRHVRLLLHQDQQSEHTRSQQMR